MTARRASARHHPRDTRPPRVGVFGLLGAGNVGNDGSLEAILAYLASEHPDARPCCLCSGPARITARYGIPATALHWYYARDRTSSAVPAAILKAVGKVFDVIRTLRWVRGCDVVIVPGTGVLETTLPIRAWGFPYALFLLCASGTLVGTKVALVNVGSNVIRQRCTRWLSRSAARLATYRSFRDAGSRDAMLAMGLDTSRDDVYPDLVFALPSPPATPGAGRTVGVGVMAYQGSNDDRRYADSIHARYVEAMKRFVRWLVDSDYRVSIFTGDELDEPVAEEIVADIHASRPHISPSAVTAEPTSTLTGLMRRMSAVDVVVGTRYHNVVCALKLAKPTLSISYSEKSDRIMTRMGQDEFCQPARAVDADRLIEQFTTLERRSAQVRATIAERVATQEHTLARQYAVLSAALFPARDSTRPVSVR